MYLVSYELSGRIGAFTDRAQVVVCDCFRRRGGFGHCGSGMNKKIRN